MRFGFLYQHPWIYDFALYGLYHGDPQARFKQVANEIPEGASVVDLCTGTSFLFKQLQDRCPNYQAFDINPRLVKHLQKQGINAQCFDVRTDTIPQADVVTMCSSLYHFHPNCRDIIQQMQNSAHQKVIVLEPVHNAKNSRFASMRWLGAQAGIVDGKINEFYFSPEAFQDLIKNTPGFQKADPAGNGRDMLAIFDGCASKRIQTKTPALS
jgi:hypothetical protein